MSTVTKLQNVHVKFPYTDAEMKNTKEDFFKLANFPNVLEALDGTLIPVQGPSRDEHFCFCHKGYHAINVQCIVSANGVFLDIVAKWPGVTHDALIRRNSGIAELFENGKVDGDPPNDFIDDTSDAQGEVVDHEVNDARDDQLRGDGIATRSQLFLAHFKN
ncbi:putative nuclease HARBI1 [Gigantopelta aegis]|uniref:putative nuclease HARBI1 n=1 Tax=Gigantopelta aegis TaxID=1735272 RepID=UPI001B887E97|nr:putative nuclease HARBI1 [Gigantopelta aegis]